MREIKNGGPAFPVVQPAEHHGIEHGMSLRDYFAAKTMQAVISGTMASGADLSNGDPKAISATAYAIADVMLRAREA